MTEVNIHSERGDDALHVLAIQCVRPILGQGGRLYIGDSKMAALGTRALLKYGEDGYVVPLPMTGEVPALLETLLEPVWNRQRPQERIYDDAEGTTKTEPQLLSLGYGTSRDHEAQVEGARVRWKERVYAPAHAKCSQQDLERRLERAERALQVLTPPLARGRGQWSDETALSVEAEATLKRHQLKGPPLGIRPLYVKRDDHATGLARLLALALRALTLVEYVV